MRTLLSSVVFASDFNNPACLVGHTGLPSEFFSNHRVDDTESGSMPSESPTPEEIIEAVSATGFVMEQRVATVLESLGFVTLTAYPFQDPDDPQSCARSTSGHISSSRLTRRKRPTYQLNCCVNARTTETRSFFFVGANKLWTTGDLTQNSTFSPSINTKLSLKTCSDPYAPSNGLGFKGTTTTR